MIGRSDDLANPVHCIAEHGFAILHGVLTRFEVEALTDEFARTLRQGKAGIRHALSNSRISAVAHETRLLDMVRAILGEYAFPFRATLLNKSRETNWLITWHQDTALPLQERRDISGWGPWSVKEGIIYAHAPAIALNKVLALRLHLDDSTAANGPLRVLPSTHTLGVLTNDAICDLASNTPAVNCLVPQGGVLAMRPLLVHASSKSQAKGSRRVLHIEYAQSAIPADGLRLAVA